MNRFLRKTQLGLLALALAGLVLAGSATADVALQDGLIAYWAFDEGAGTTVADSIGGANGTVTGGTWATGKFNGGFDHYDYWGNPDGVAIGNPASLNIATNAVTISTWLYLPTMPEFQPEGFVAVYDSLADGYVMYLDRGRKEIRMKVTSVRDPLPGETPSVWGDIQVGYARAGVDQANLTLNTWHHVVGTFDGTYVKMYCDGQLMSTVGLNAVGEKLRVGQYASMGYEMADPGAATPADRYAWDGKMDDTAIWNRALNANEIAYLYNEGTGRTVTSTNPIITPPDPPSPTLPNPVVHWEFDGGLTNSGTGGAAYNGTMVTGSQGSYAYEAGPTGSGLQALRLNNDGDGHFTNGHYVSTPYVMTDEGTISFWCKPNTSWFNYMSLFDNSGDPSLSDANRGDDWEMWIYSNGQARWRIEAGFATADLDDFGGVGQWQHITASWQQYEGVQKASVFLYVNGEFVSGTDDTWVNPGSTFYLGGGNDKNEYAVASFADFRIYDVALTPEQISQLAQLATAPIPGDATGNGIVDDEDAKRLAAHWGATTLAEGLTWWEMGDFNNDNVIDARDAAIMAANWGYGPSEATAVPEPSMWLLLTASLAILLARRQR